MSDLNEILLLIFMKMRLEIEKEWYIELGQDMDTNLLNIKCVLV